MRAPLRSAGLAVLPLTALSLSLALTAPAASAAPAVAAPAAGSTLPGTSVPLVVGPAADAVSAVGVSGADSGTITTATATFRVTYTGFTTAAKASFARAVATWSRTITSSVPITIAAKYERLGPGVLGSAGPGTFVRDFQGAPKAGTFYPEALANKYFRGQTVPGTADIQASFSSAFAANWYFGTGAAPVGKYDFQSVVTHELGHGLGFLGFGRLTPDGTQGAVRLSGYPSPYDRFVENGSGTAILTFADPSAALKTQFTSGRLFFDSPAVRNAHGGTPVKLYAPASFQGGSSYSHLDEATFRKGNADSLMTPQLSDGETIRTAGPVTRAVFASIGW